jgi:hypothetical protein
VLRVREAIDRQGRAGLLGLLAAVVFILVGIGTPLLGIKTFHGADTASNLAPWFEERTTPHDQSVAPLNDTFDAIAPPLVDFKQRFWHGDLALTTPNEAGGQDLAVSPIAAVFDPMNLPWLVLPDRIAPAYAKLLELMVGIGFTYLFCRRLRLGPAPSWLAGIVFASTGFQDAWTNWPHTHAAALVPPMMWASERLLQRRRWRDAGILALAFAASLTTGFPAVTLYGGYLVAGYLLVRLFWIHRDAGWALIRSHVARLATAGIVGVAAVTPLVLGLRGQLNGTDLSYRDSFRGIALPTKYIVTTVFPFAYGNPEWARAGTSVAFITFQSFLGVTALTVAIAGFARRGPVGLDRGVRWYFAAVALVLTVAIYLGGPVIQVVQLLPGVGSSPIERTRIVVALAVAVLAACGLEVLLDPRTRRSRRFERNYWGAMAVVALLGIVATARWIRPILSPLVPAMVESAIGVLVVVVLGALTIAWRRRSGADVGGIVCLIAAVEALFLVIPYWHRAEAFYPRSPSVDALVALQGSDRVDGLGVQMTGTSSFYDARTATGHLFHTMEWSDLLRAADPSVFTTPTYSLLKTPTAAVYDSKVLDRLSVRYLLVGRNVLLPGRAEASEATDAPADRLLRPGTWISGAVRLDQLRGVGLVIGEPTDLPGAAPKLELELRDSTGAVIATNEKTIPNHLQQLVEVAIDPGASTGEGTLRMRLVDTEGAVQLAPAGGAVFRVVHGDGSDDLEMVAAVPGGAIFRRPDALPRYRWASTSQVIGDTHDRLAALVAGVPADTVVLDEASGAQEGGTGSVVSIDEGDPDDRTIVTRSDGPGYLVIADAVRRGWRATVDGEDAEVLTADHALMAIAVPAGEHTIGLTYTSPGGKPALALSLLGFVAIALLLLQPRWLPRLAGDDERLLDPTDDGRQAVGAV